MQKINLINLTIALYTTLIVGCSSIPLMTPDMALQSPHKVQLEGANGSLSNAQSKLILTKLKKDGEDTSIFDRHLALESEIVGSPLIIGNKVDLLIDGPSTYQAMMLAIENAKDHINMETYIIEDDEIGQKFSEAFIKKQQSGVQVNLIYDSVGSSSAPKEFFKKLSDAGVNVLEYNPINPLNTRKGWDVNQRDHRKLLIVDGEIAFVGGINISSVYSSGSFGGSSSKPNRKSKKHQEQKQPENSIHSNVGNPSLGPVLVNNPPHPPAASEIEGTPWRDTHMQMTGPVVAEFQKLFFETWAAQKGHELARRNYYPALTNQGNEIVRAIGSTPDEPYSQIYSTLISAINSAETQIFLTNAYFVPDAQLLAALKEAVARGVDVRLLLPEKTDSNMVFHASRSFYDELLNAGVKIYERQGALLHAKTALIDGVWSTIGSTNLDWRSFVHNQEINAVMLGQDFGGKMQQVFEKDLAESKQITLKDWRSRSVTTRLKEQAARLWARFL
ncbi:phospholipase D-like domain-containing protein [Methylotenera versatilis]|uniref:phospholipase D-like domain-containing protein n=1 Tax=Methylotenera versatilis TaxID=1055487 RepID=UPI0006482FB0|nr:phospholipase D-like domain-containing protein [Methylotenera versatilis]